MPRKILTFWILTVISLTLSGDAAPTDTENLLHPRVVRSVFNGKNYHFGTVARVNWFQANNYCRLNRMELVNIVSEAENNFIENQLVELGYFMEAFWLSGNDLAETNSFVWGNGRPFVYHNFGFLDEEVEGSHCVVKVQEDLSERFYWNVHLCNSQHYFLCESSVDDNCNPIVPTPPPPPPSSTTTSTTSGPPTVTPPEPEFGIKYRIVGQYSTFEDAYLYCQNTSMSLAAIFSTFENDRLNNAIQASGLDDSFFWLSLNDLFEDGNFVWTSYPDEIPPFTNWGIDQPTIDTNEHCAGVGYTDVDGHIVWQNRNCEESHFFACEYF